MSYIKELVAKSSLRAFVTFTIVLVVAFVFVILVAVSSKDIKIVAQVDLGKLFDAVIYAFMFIVGYLFAERRERREVETQNINR
jgi:uncharacterized membrane protein (DUF485 family)